MSAVLLFVACGDSKKAQEETSAKANQAEQVKFKIGATPLPHGKILEFIKDDLAADGVELEIIGFTDYVLPNVALADKSLDANFFQHQPYLDKMKERSDIASANLISVAKIHIEPLGAYSKSIKDINELKDGDKIAIPNDPSNLCRALLLLHANEIISLKDPDNLVCTEQDISSNPKNLSIHPLEAPMLPRTLEDTSLAIINGNFALEAQLKISDALLLEGSTSPYANIVVVREENKDDEAVNKLVKALTTQKVKDFIVNEFEGVIPVF